MAHEIGLTICIGRRLNVLQRDPSMPAASAVGWQVTVILAKCLFVKFTGSKTIKEFST